MRILALSDLCWNRNSILIENIDSLTCSQILNSPDLFKVAEYYHIVTEVNPDILLLCGDITGDGSCGEGHAVSLICFLRLLEEKKIITRYIPGDHDEAYGSQYLNEFQEVNKYFYNSKYIKQATSEIENINNINIAGLTYNQTRTKSAIKQALKNLNGNIDVLFCHCPHTHRLHLFDFKTEFIITGHYDLKVINPNHKTFISLYNDSPRKNFVVLDISPKIKKIIYFIHNYGAQKWTYFAFVKTINSFLLKDTNYKDFSEDLYNTCPIKNISLNKNKLKIILKNLFNHCPYNSFPLKGKNYENILKYVFNQCPFKSSFLTFTNYKNLSKNLINICPFKTLYLKDTCIKNLLEDLSDVCRNIYNLSYQNAIEEIQNKKNKGLKLNECVTK